MDDGIGVFICSLSVWIAYATASLVSQNTYLRML